ncbi:MAG: PQQ-binding-like beta-propeller repeat protein [Planctomycetes bacterium]|nr:PQQ-binding-like beta-propeller repeat protein [Planctomycetota bacterium]
MRAILCAAAIILTQALTGPLATEALGQGLPADEEVDLSSPRIEVSERAEILLADMRRHLTEGNYEAALRLLEQLRDVGPEVVLPQDGRGVLVALREMFLSLPEATRQLWANTVQSQAQEALDRAGRQGTEQAWIDLLRWFPGTDASRRAAERLTAQAFEQGRFRRTVELAQMALADTDLSAQQRTRTLLLMGLAGAELGDRAICAAALDQVRQGGVKAGIRFLGDAVEPAAMLGEALDRVSEQQDRWENVGGQVTREGASSATVELHGLMTVGDHPAVGESAWQDGAAPTRKQLLAVRQPVAGSWLAEQPVLVTPRTLIVAGDGTLTAYDRFGGDRLWQVNSLDEHVRTQTSWPSAGDEAVAVVSSGVTRDEDQDRRVILLGARPRMPVRQQMLLVLSEADGRQLWTWDGTLPNSGTEASRLAPAARETSDRMGLEPVGSPLIYGGRLFVGAVRRQYENKLVDSYLMCFDLRDGRLLWQRFLGSGAVALCGAAGTTADRMVPTTDGQRVYVESAVGTLVAIDLATSDVAWTRRMPAAARPASRFGVAVANWEGGIIDAPIVADGERLLVMDVYSDKTKAVLRCLDARTGRDTWQAGPVMPCRRMIAGDKVLLVDRHSVTAYDLSSGRELFTTSTPLEDEVVGRGFATATAAYLPTNAGILVVDFETHKAAYAHTYDEGTLSSVALVPMSGGLVSNHISHLRLFGSLDEYTARVRRGMAEHPGDPVWTRRLAELRRQQKDFPAAEKLLQQALAEADALGDTERRRDEKLAIFDRLGRLQLLWARDLLAQGKADLAIRRLQGVLDATADEAAAARVRMMLADVYRERNDRLQAAANYARVAGEDVASRLLVPTDQQGLEQSLATQAIAALDAVRQTERQQAPAGFMRGDLGRLGVERIGMLTWGGPSLAQVDGSHGTSPILWARTDGLIGLGPAGEIRWRQARVGQITDSFDTPVMAAGMFFECSRDNLLAHRLSDGHVAWAWRTPTGRVTATWAQDNRLLPQRRIEGFAMINGRRIRVFNPVEQAQDRIALVAVGRMLVTVTYRIDGSSPVLHGLDAASGQQVWERPLPKDSYVEHLVCNERNVFVASQRKIGPLEVLCVDAARGEPRWTASRLPKLYSESLFVGNGVLVHMDVAGRPWVIDMDSGDTLWKSARDYNQWPDAEAVYADKDVTVFAFVTGHVVFSNRSGGAVWQVGSAMTSRRTVFVAGAAHMAAWNRQAVVGSLLITWQSENEGDFITAWQLSDGRVVWKHRLDERSASGYNFALCGDMLVCHDVGDVGFRRVGDTDAGRERSLCFLDPHSGKYLGSLELGAGSSRDGMHPQIEVYGVPGGLVVLNGDEMLAVRPGDRKTP